MIMSNSVLETCLRKKQHQLSSCHDFIQVRESNTLWVSVLCDFPIHLSRNIIRVQQSPFCFEWKAWHGRFPLNTSYQPSVVWIIWAPFPYLGRTSAAFASAKANSASSGSSWTHQFEQQQQLPHTPESRLISTSLYDMSCLKQTSVQKCFRDLVWIRDVADDIAFWTTIIP